MFVNDFLRDILAMDPHVLIKLHKRLEKKVFDIICAKTGSMLSIQDYTIDMYFSISGTHSRRSDILKSIQFITTNGKVDPIDFSFVGINCAHHVGISDFLVGWDLGRVNEKDGVGAFDGIILGALFANTLGTVAKFVGA